MPVSNFTWTPTGRPRRRRETSSSRRAKSRSLSAASNRCSTISGACSGSSAPRTRISPAIPASRSAAPSSTSATPNRFTPSAASVRLTATAPWPYASALTMPMISTAGPTSARIARRLSRTAERSISAIGGARHTVPAPKSEPKIQQRLLFVIVILIVIGRFLRLWTNVRVRLRLGFTDSGAQPVLSPAGIWYRYSSVAQSAASPPRTRQQNH